MSDDNQDLESSLMLPILISNSEYLELSRSIHNIIRKYSDYQNQSWEEVNQAPKEQREAATRSLYCKQLYLSAKEMLNEMINSRKRCPKLPYASFFLIDPVVVKEAQNFINLERGRNFK